MLGKCHQTFVIVHHSCCVITRGFNMLYHLGHRSTILNYKKHQKSTLVGMDRGLFHGVALLVFGANLLFALSEKGVIWWHLHVVYKIVGGSLESRSSVLLYCQVRLEASTSTESSMNMTTVQQGSLAVLWAFVVLSVFLYSQSNLFHKINIYLWNFSCANLVNVSRFIPHDSHGAW